MQQTLGLVASVLVVLSLAACGGGSSAPPPAPPTPELAPLPLKVFDAALIGVHDEGSADYNADCVSCHGDRVKEKALDGVTPSAHATMLTAIPETGNARCLHCHAASQDFITRSAGGLREPVNVELTLCTACHGASGTPSFYVR